LGRNKKKTKEIVQVDDETEKSGSRQQENITDKQEEKSILQISLKLESDEILLRARGKNNKKKKTDENREKKE